MSKVKALFVSAVLVFALAFHGMAEEKTRTVYMVELDIRNSSVSLSISKHIRNAMNAFQIELPVDKDFYDSVKVNQEIASNFKAASFLMKGSVSSVKITVVRKWTTQVKSSDRH